ncbi:MAG: ribonuclease D [Candidatus Omnitrophota bacterium]
MKYIDRDDLLAEACRAIRESPWAAVDTEADSLHHYYEKLCLVQVSVPGEDFLIDPLSSLDLSPLIGALNPKPILMHGADFDIRMLRRSGGFLPREVFDTMIAAQLLGHEGQGLADLVQKYCGETLSKVSQKADWSRRPLDDKLMTYAWKDTHYLSTVSDNLRKELSALGRTEWHRQCCARLVESLTSGGEERKPSEHPWQIKGSKQLSGRALAVLKELWMWREEEAKRRDRPTFKVLHSETLVDIARWAEKAPGADVAALPNAPRNVRGEHREALNRALSRSRALPPLAFVAEKKPAHKRRRRLDANDEKILESLKKERQEIAAELKIQPSLLATNAVLEIFAAERPQTPEGIRALDCLMPWQAEILSKALLKVLGQ